MRLKDKLLLKRPLILDGGLATTLESYGCNLNITLWSSEILKMIQQKSNKPMLILHKQVRIYC